MRVTICLDVDGTIETSAGPVTVAQLRELDQLEGCTVVIVSPSAARPTGFAERIGDNRIENLVAAARDFPADLLVYVSDNADQAAAAAAGFCYIDRMEFR